MSEGGHMVRAVLDELEQKTKPGITTYELNSLALEYIKKFKPEPKPSFLGYNKFPAAVCISINNEVIHGIPSKKRVIQEGDLVSLDFGLMNKGFHADSAVTFVVGQGTDEAYKLVEVTRQALAKGIKEAVIGNRLHDVSSAIQEHVELNGYAVVKEFVGHGIGRRLHEEPQVPNYGEKGTGILLEEGLTIAIEPMVNIGRPEVRVLSDGWTAVTADGSLSAHFEHTIVVTANGPEILTL